MQVGAVDTYVSMATWQMQYVETIQSLLSTN